MDYGDIAWEEVQLGQTIKKICSQQKHGIQIVYSKDRLSHTRGLFKRCKVVNVYLEKYYFYASN